MTDAVDTAQELNDLALRCALSNTSEHASKLRGPVMCVRCGYPNDRRNDGWGICSDCADEMRETN